MKLSAIAQALALTHLGADVTIAGVAPVESAGADDLTYVTKKNLLSRGERAAALLLPPELAEASAKPRLITSHPAVDLGRVGRLFSLPELTLRGIHPSAVIDPSATLGEGVAVGPLAVIGPEVIIGAGSVIHAGAVIHARCRVGARCLIHSQAVIGSTGFGFEFVAGRHERIAHFGIVEIEDDVEIGAGTTIDRARFGATRIGAGSRIDNLVQIAHNVQVGRQVVIVSQVGIAGSCHIGDGVVLAGQAGLVPHVTVGAGARVGASTGVATDVPAGSVWSGWWGKEHRQSMAEISCLRALPEFMKQVKAFMKKWEGLSAGLGEGSQGR
ncbi:MAG: UDP-3-O-(3-hydroxymyristoyl)glucosamine N-acyltransferase [Magnetococcales bacterium]|nr:UDP-3-O-(3-hydroxymyristoyl)glucosamine N-acyltransferase [Magnetococcales bacterium]